MIFAGYTYGWDLYDLSIQGDFLGTYCMYIILERGAFLGIRGINLKVMNACGS